MPDSHAWLAAVRGSHDRLRALVAGLSPGEVAAPSYAREWTLAQVLSHLGSQAELFWLLLEAGLSGGTAPGRETMLPIWQRWDALPADAQVTASLDANERLVRHLERLDGAQVAAFSVAAFGREMDFVGLLRARLSEHAIHTWDVAVALDPAAVLAPDAVALLVDHLPEMAARVGKPAARPETLAVSTTDPERHLTLSTGGVRLDPGSVPASSGSLRLPAEALIRLVYGRLDPAHTPALALLSPTLTLDELRDVFPGF
ncbi:MAG: maleylpyruvate isomerase family mycothiol-dependent enzyme [Candidatus Dormibacteria bacterium]|jgi:uncharacterized protein (TIGR03083 family)